MRPSLMHPLRRWWLKRRVRGGVRNGVSREDAFKKLGTANRDSQDEPYAGDVVWIYELGKGGGYQLDYSVLIRDEKVFASWWTETLER